MRGQQHERLWRACHTLDAVAARPMRHHWIGGDDAGPSYCTACACERVAWLRKCDPDGRGEYWVDGGWEAHTEDHAAFCETCGEMLEFTLTDYAVGEELAHYAENGLSGPINPWCAYELSAVISAAGYGKHEEPALALAETACGLITLYGVHVPRLPAPTNTQTCRVASSPQTADAEPGMHNPTFPEVKP